MGASGRGPKNLRWPWGNDWQEGKANTEEAKLGETSPVGMFPGGASPEGLLDMAGNVWEWTRSKWGMDIRKPTYGYPYEWQDGREALSGPDFRVVRGAPGTTIRGTRGAAFR